MCAGRTQGIGLLGVLGGLHRVLAPYPMLTLGRSSGSPLRVVWIPRLQGVVSSCLYRVLTAVLSLRL